jgi:hypothetical protein
VNTLTAARLEMESIDIVDEGRRPDEGVFGSSTVTEQVAPGESPRDDRKETGRSDGVVPDLAGVSETML